MVDLKDLASKSTSTSSLPFDEKRPQPTVPDVEASKEAPEEWKAHKREYLVMASLAVISLVVALDATILVLVLPVMSPFFEVEDYGLISVFSLVDTRKGP